MKTSFSMKVTGSITVSIEPPSNEDGGGGGDGSAADDVGSILVDVILKSLVNDAVKKYVCDKRITVEEEEEEEEEEEDDFSSPIPKRRIPVDADDSVEDEEASVEEDDDEDEAGDLPNLNVEYAYADENNLSQKMDMMNLRHRH
jgi:hypothetical protein